MKLANLTQFSILQAAILIGVGLFIYFSPGLTLRIVLVLLGLIMLLEGARQLRGWWQKRSTFLARVNLAQAVVSVVSGSILLVYPDLTAWQLSLLLCSWLILSGMGRIVLGLRLPAARTQKVARLSLGLGMLLAGAVLWINRDLEYARQLQNIGSIVGIIGCILLGLSLYTMQKSEG